MAPIKLAMSHSTSFGVVVAAICATLSSRSGFRWGGLSFWFAADGGFEGLGGHRSISFQKVCLFQTKDARFAELYKLFVQIGMRGFKRRALKRRAECVFQVANSWSR